MIVPKIFKNKISKLAQMNEWPAGMMDRIYLDEPTHWYGYVLNFIKLRLIYVALFLPLTFFSAIFAGIFGVINAITTFFVSDAQQDAQLQKQKKYATAFSKNVMGLMAGLPGLIYPKFNAFYFTPENKNTSGVISGGGYYHSKEATLLYPENEASLLKIIADAKKNGKKVIAVGAGFSQGKQFIPSGKNGIAVNLESFDTIEINATDKTATVGAGVRWFDLQREADKLGLSLQVMQASNVFSVGGSIGTNVHGWDHKKGMLSNTIISIDIINADGKKQTLTPSDALFHHVTGGLGLFGVVIKVTFKLTDNVMLKETCEKIAIADYVTRFEGDIIKNDKVRMHLYRLSVSPNNMLKEGIATNYECTDGEPKKTKNLSFEGVRGTRTQRIMVNLARRFKLVRAFYWWAESKRMLSNKAAPVTRNETMQPPINAMFNPSVSEAEWLQEYFIPGSKLNDFISKLGKLLTENEVVLLNASVRFVANNADSPFSYAKDGDRYAVVLCFNQSLQPKEIVKAKKWLREAQRLTVEHDGAFYLPYQHVSDPDDFQKSYQSQNIQAIQEKKKEVDPSCVFSSGFSDKYVMPENAKKSYFYTIMSSEKSKDEFAGFLKNVLQRVDTEKFYTLLKDVMTYNDTHDEIYSELQRRLGEIMPGTVSSLKRILNSLSAIKHDLADQAASLIGDVKTINGLVEIGYPGRFVGGFKNRYNMKGKVVAVFEAESVTDYVQTGFPRPYDQFKQLNYDAPNLTGLSDSSADVITCYVGLHHFPEDKLEAFLTDVRRVLRPDGKFLLVDHDVTNENQMAMAHMAHTIFNVVTGVSVEEELAERRHFKPMTEWVGILAKHGLASGLVGADVPLVRSGDPSRNRMYCFKRSPSLVQDISDPSIASSRLKSTLGMLSVRIQSNSNPTVPAVVTMPKQPLRRTASCPQLFSASSTNRTQAGLDASVVSFKVK